jgi:LPXTG-site transpeptidase (sortase) family protein
MPVAAGDSWFRQDVTDAYTKNIIDKNAGLYLGVPVTRGQFFDMVYRMDMVTKNRLVAFQSTQQVQPSSAPVRSSSSSSSFTVVQTSSAQSSVISTAFTITIPTLGITDLAVVHPSDATTNEGLLNPLEYGVGHLFSYPGGNGKIMIYGHSSGYPWDVSKYTKIFRTVNKLEPGDTVSLNYNGKQYQYQVAFKETVAANDISPFTGEGEELILYTCWPPDSIKQRYLVHAFPVAGGMAQR